MSDTRSQTIVSEFTSDEIDVTETDAGTFFVNVTKRCDIMVGHPDSTAEEVIEEIRALRKLADVAEDVASQLETRQIRKDSAELGQRIAADEGLEPSPAADAGRAIVADLDEQTRPDPMEGFQPDPDLMCKAKGEDSPYTCTLTRGHDGDHVAHGRARWPQEG